MGGAICPNVVSRAAPVPSYLFRSIVCTRLRRMHCISRWLTCWGKGNSNSHGARPVHLIITMIRWIRTSRLSIKNSLCWGSRTIGGDAAEWGGASAAQAALYRDLAPDGTIDTDAHTMVPPDRCNVSKRRAGGLFATEIDARVDRQRGVDTVLCRDNCPDVLQVPNARLSGWLLGGPVSDSAIGNGAQLQGLGSMIPAHVSRRSYGPLEWGPGISPEDKCVLNTLQRGVGVLPAEAL